MGAEFNTQTFPACSDKELANQVEAMCYDAQARLGYEYSGSWGSCNNFDVVIKDRTFLNEDEAFNWLSDNHRKYDAPWVVKFYEAELTPKIEKAQAKCLALDNDLRGITSYHGKVQLVNKAVFTRVKMGKSRLRACPECDSRLAVKHLRENNCPVCGAEELFLTDGDRRKLISLRKKVANIEQAIAQQAQYIENLKQAEIKKQKKWAWAVGAWCSS